MTMAHDLAHATLDRLVAELDLQEVTGANGGPLLTLVSEAARGAEVGALRVLHGGPVHKLVYIGLTLEAIGLDSHMVFAFTAPDSLVPHFTLDSVQSPAGPPGPDTPIMKAFHLDLIPRVDLAANLAYTDVAYTPLTEAWEATVALEGLTEAVLSRRQWSVMSPWMLANRADDKAFAAIGDTTNAYLDHWLELCRDGLDMEVLGIDPAVRDRAHRAILFNPDVDPVWAQVARIVGDDTAERLRAELERQELPDAVATAPTET